MTTLTSAELAVLSQMQAQATPGNYWPIYQWLADLLTTSYSVPATDPTVLWLRGAAEANAGRGAMSALIRAYTETQHLLRYGDEPTRPQVQAASDEVAKRLLEQLLGQDRDGWPIGKVPDIDNIADKDATAVGFVLFNRDLADTAAELKANSAWSGALLFTLLRSDQSWRLLSTGSTELVDTLNGPP